MINFFNKKYFVGLIIRKKQFVYVFEQHIRQYPKTNYNFCVLLLMDENFGAVHSFIKHNV